MGRTAIDQLIPRADKHIIRAFPRVAQRLESQVDDMDRAEMDTFLKMLPGAIERFQTITGPTNDLHESVETAIIQLVASFPKQSFGSQAASEVDPAPQVGTRNTPLGTGETADGASEPDRPEGSDTDQSVAPMSLPHDDLDAPTGNCGEPGSEQAGPRNPRVRTGSKLSGRAAGKRTLLAAGKAAHDRGRLSEPDGRVSVKE